MEYLLCGLAGIFLVGFLKQSLSAFLLMGTLFAFLMGKRREFSRKKVGALFLCFVLGAIYTHGYFTLNEKKYGSVYLENTSCEIQIISSIREWQNSVQFEGRMLSPYRTRVTVKLSLEGIPPISSYDQILLPSSRISSFSHKSSFSDFDYPKYMYAKDLRLLVEGKGKEAIVKKQAGSGHPLKLLLNLRQKIDYVLYRYFDSEPYMLLNGILLGDSDIRSQEFDEMMAVTGLSHIVVVSGMHFSILVLFLSTLLRRLGVGRKAASVVVLLFSFVLGLFIGFSPSVVRAMIAVVILCLADILERERKDSYYFLALTALLMLLKNPYLSYHLGFLLSFASMLGILLYYDRFYLKWSKIPKVFRDNGALSLSASVFTLPLTAYGFSRISLVFLVGNLLITPFISFLMLWSFLVIFLSSFHLLLGYYSAIPLNYLLKGLLTVIRWLAQLPFASFRVVEISSAWVLSYYLFFVFLSLKSFYWKRVLGILFGLVLTLTLLFPIGDLFMPGVTLTVLEGNESGRSVIKSKTKIAVVDFSADKNAEELLALLDRKGILVEHYIIRNMDQLPALEKVLKTTSIKNLYYPVSLEENPYFKKGLEEFQGEKYPVSHLKTIEMKDFTLTLTTEKGYNISVVEILRKENSVKIVGDYNYPFTEGEAYVLIPGIIRMLKNQQELERFHILNLESNGRVVYDLKRTESTFKK